jgi:hypothetical protein
MERILEPVETDRCIENWSGLKIVHFAAWGCGACGWIMPNPRSASSDAPSAEVKEAFNSHECQKHPRKTERT